MGWANDSGWSGWPQVLDLTKKGSDRKRFKRPPPLDPRAFYEDGAFGKQIYTNPHDRDLIVAPKFERTVKQLLAGTAELNFSRMSWGAEDVLQLAAVLPLCRGLRTLKLASIGINDVGALALAKTLGSCTALRLLALNGNAIGDKGARALADSLTRCPEL